MSNELLQIFSDIKGRPARFRAPLKAIFFCGGEMAETGAASSLRDYLYRTRHIKLAAKLVLAEKANQLYRDTSYSDLISFEEDIARIASLVVVVAESPGSLAELGAFSVNDTVRPAVRLLCQSRYEDAESFIRYGPIQKILAEDEGRVGFYPWEVTKAGRVIISTARPHYMEMKRFISNHVDSTSETENFHQEYSIQKFFVIYWSLYLAYASSIRVLLKSVQLIYPDIQQSDLKNALYCLKILGWVDRTSYSGKEYYFALGDHDPIDYRFLRSTPPVDMFARREKVRTEFRANERLPDHIITLVAGRRAGA